MDSEARYDFALERLHFPETYLLDVPGETYTCGRGKENEILCVSLSISRRHCSFFRNNHEVYVCDHGSANGTYVNGIIQNARRMIRLHENDIIGLGTSDVNDNSKNAFIFKLCIIDKYSAETQVMGALKGPNNNKEVDGVTNTQNIMYKRKANEEVSTAVPLFKVPKLVNDNNFSLRKNISSTLEGLMNKSEKIDQDVEIVDIDMDEEDPLKSWYSEKDNKENSFDQTSMIHHKQESKESCYNPVEEIEIKVKDDLEQEMKQEKLDHCIIQSVEKDSNKNIKSNINKNIVNSEQLDHSECDTLQKNMLELNLDLPANIVSNGDYLIKLEDELIISDDNDEKAVPNLTVDCNNYIKPSVKVKQCKQELKTQFSEIDVVNLSDDEENLFPSSQLFDSGFNITCNVKEELKLCSDGHDEELNKPDHHNVILLSESEDEDNIWLEKLSKSQMFNEILDTAVYSDTEVSIPEHIKEEFKYFNIIEENLKSIIDITDESGSKHQFNSNKGEGEKNIKTKNKKQEECGNSTVNTWTEKICTVSYDIDRIQINDCTNKAKEVTETSDSNLDDDIGSKKRKEKYDVKGKKGDKKKKNDDSEQQGNAYVTSDTLNKNVRNETINSVPCNMKVTNEDIIKYKQPPIATKKVTTTPKKTQMIDPLHVHRKERKQKEQFDKIENTRRCDDRLQHSKSVHSKEKNVQKKDKIEQSMYLKEQQRRRKIYTWADCLPPRRVNNKNILSKEAKERLIQNRKARLKELATEDKQSVATDTKTVKHATKPIVKVSSKSRGDYLIDDMQKNASVTKSAKEVGIKNATSKSTSKRKSRGKSSTSKETLNDVTENLQRTLMPGEITDITKARKDENCATNSKKCEGSSQIKSNQLLQHDVATVKDMELSMNKSRKDVTCRTDLDNQKENCAPYKEIRKHEKEKKKVFFSEHNEIYYYEIESENTLKKLMGKDAPIPIDKLTTKTNIGKGGLNIKDFLARIFSWNPVWLEEQQRLKTLPPIVANDELHPMLTSYASYSDYYKIVVPLLLLEIWWEVTKEFEMIEKNYQRPTMMCSIANISMSTENKFLSKVIVEVLITKEQMSKQAHSIYGDLVFFEYIVEEKGKYVSHKAFAYVVSMHQAIITDFTHYNKDLLNFVEKPYAVLTYSLLTRRIEENIVKNRVQRIRTVTYLRSNMRMVQAIQYLPQTPLMNLILHPKTLEYQLPEVETNNYQLVTKEKLNDKQLEAVARITETVVQNTAKVCFIQGPPGTGKSKVIVNTITEILYGNERYNKNRVVLPILVCAPSNAAIDEIVLRLLAIRTTIKENRFKMVRVGRPETMNTAVRDISLIELGKREVKRTTANYTSKNIPADSLEEEKVFLEARINALKCEIANSHNLDETYKNSLKMKLADMTAKYEILKNNKRKTIEEMSPHELAKLQRAAENRLLAKADVIACTLSSCYTNQMEFIFGGNKQKISVCIVDEATQSCEAETLIPLLLGVNILVLVGDPNQLPATVISQQAKHLGLDQSLFSRVQNAFQGCANNPIIMLNTQYRMAHSICYWPNKYFYGGKLRSATENITAFPLHSYRVLNLNSNENNDKFSNTDEANFIANIILCVITLSDIAKWKSNISIGVLTPYNNQRFLISQKINEKLLNLSESIKKRFTIETNTVDSFQGQERDVIVMSCVRTRGIGFLSDRQRLCVALTRAKHSLILCGNFYTFMRDPTWNALLTDAKSRKVYHSISITADLHNIKERILK